METVNRTSRRVKFDRSKAERTGEGIKELMGLDVKTPATSEELRLPLQLLASAPYLTVATVMAALKDDDAGLGGYDEHSVEQWLRRLTARGWLHMSAARDPESNAFIEFRWELS